MEKLNLYRLTWSHACGVYWMFCRAVTPDTAAAWQRIFEGDDGAEYTTAPKPPAITPDMHARAKHPATL